MRVKTPLPIPKLYGSYSGHSYILSSLRKERLGEKGGAFFNGKEGRDDFRNSYVRTKISNMNIIDTSIDGVLIIESRLFRAPLIPCNYNSNKKANVKAA